MKYITLLLLVTLLVFGACKKKVAPTAFPPAPDTMYIPAIYRALNIYYFDKDNKDSSLLVSGHQQGLKVDSVNQIYSSNSGGYYLEQYVTYPPKDTTPCVKITYIEPGYAPFDTEHEVSTVKTIIVSDITYIKKFRFRYQYMIFLNNGERDLVEVVKEHEGYKVEHYLNNKLVLTTEVEDAEDVQEFTFYR